MYVPYCKNIIQYYTIQYIDFDDLISCSYHRHGYSIQLIIFSRKQFGRSITTATVEFHNKTESLETDVSFEEMNHSGGVTPTGTGNSVPGV